MTPFGLTPSGFNAKRLADVKQDLENAFIAQFGNINLDSQSVFGQQIGVLSKSLADIWENLEDVYFSQYPNSASGTSLDNVVQLNGITRRQATQTAVTASCSGTEGTFIPINSLASIPSTQNIFYANVGGTITINNSDVVEVQVQNVTNKSYTVQLNGLPFIFSLPHIVFTNSGAKFYAGNVITVTLNGVQLPSVSFITDSNTTLAAIATQIALVTSVVSSATPTNPGIIDIVPVLGQSVVINNVLITGPTPATVFYQFDTPSDQNEITQYLSAVINAGTPPWAAVDNMDGTLTITTTNPAIPFVAAVGTNLSIIYQSSPITFLAEDFGPIPCPVGALTNIITPIAGWQSITNEFAGVTGLTIETDAQLRIRRLNSLSASGFATVEAIRSKLLQVAGVIAALVYENTSLTQQPIIITFPGQFVSGDVITVTYNTINNFTVNFDTNQADTMADLVTAFEALPGVASATYGGSGNQVLTVNMLIFNVLTVNDVVTNTSLLTAIITGGLPPKSFTAIVQGGDPNEIANTIWQTKPAGIATYGNTAVTIIDSQGDDQVIFFSIPQPIYIWVEVALTLYTEETFPPNGLELVAQAIYNYGVSLGIGVDVLLQRVNAQIFTVSGIASGDMEIAFTLQNTDEPSFGTDDIIIDPTQISVWNLDMINVTLA